MTKLEASQLVAVLFASYPNAHLDRSHVDAYVTGIVDLSATPAAEAVTRLRRTSRFLPSVAEIRDACTAQTHGPRARGEEAYAALMMACRRHGYDYGPIDAGRRSRDPLFGDPLIERCLTMWGGWNAFALADHDAADRARFIALYDELAGRERQDLAAGKRLPAPVTQGATTLPPPKAEPLPVPLTEAPIAELLATLTPKPAANREQAQPRRWTAEELDAALAGGSR